MIEPKFDASRLKGGSTGLIKSIADRRLKDFKKQQKPILEDLAKQREEIKAAPAKAAKKRSDAAKKGAATRAKNRQAAKDAANTPPKKTWNPIKKSTVSGQGGGVAGRPATAGTTTPKASKPAKTPKAPSTKRTPPAKTTKPVQKVGSVTKKPQRGRAR